MTIIDWSRQGSSAIINNEEQSNSYIVGPYSRWKKSERFAPLEFVDEKHREAKKHN